jgi:hypothetical protein
MHEVVYECDMAVEIVVVGGGLVMAIVGWWWWWLARVRGGGGDRGKCVPLGIGRCWWQ